MSIFREELKSEEIEAIDGVSGTLDELTIEVITVGDKLDKNLERLNKTLIMLTNVLKNQKEAKDEAQRK